MADKIYKCLIVFYAVCRYTIANGIGISICGFWKSTDVFEKWEAFINVPWITICIFGWWCFCCIEVIVGLLLRCAISVDWRAEVVIILKK